MEVEDKIRQRLRRSALELKGALEEALVGDLYIWSANGSLHTYLVNLMDEMERVAVLEDLKNGLEDDDWPSTGTTTETSS